MKLNNIQPLLDDIQLSEGELFTYDEKKIKQKLENTSSKSSVIVKVLSIIGGILGTMAFLGFLAISRVFESETTLMALGIIFIGAALITNRFIHHTLIDTSIITLFIVGYILFGAGIGGRTHDSEAVTTSYLILSLISILVSINFMPVFISVLIFNGTLLSYFFEVKDQNTGFLIIIVFGFFFTLITLNEIRLIRLHRIINQWYKPIQSAYFLSFIAGLFLVSNNGRFYFYFDTIWVLSLFIALGLFYIIYKVTKSLEIKNTTHILLLCLFCLIFLIPTIYAPSISGSIFLLLLTYYYGYKSEMIISVICLVYFISQYYYDLELTLLVKSELLIVSGLLIIGVWFFLNKQLKKDENI